MWFALSMVAVLVSVMCGLGYLVRRRAASPEPTFVVVHTPPSGDEPSYRYSPEPASAPPSTDLSDYPPDVGARYADKPLRTDLYSTIAGDETAMVQACGEAAAAREAREAKRRAHKASRREARTSQPPKAASPRGARGERKRASRKSAQFFR